MSTDLPHTDQNEIGAVETSRTRRETSSLGSSPTGDSLRSRNRRAFPLRRKNKAVKWGITAAQMCVNVCSLPVQSLAFEVIIYRLRRSCLMLFRRLLLPCSSFSGMHSFLIQSQRGMALAHM